MKKFLRELRFEVSWFVYTKFMFIKSLLVTLRQKYIEYKLNKEEKILNKLLDNIGG